MYCRNCGKEIDENAYVCPHCGVMQSTPVNEVDHGGFGWGVLGCCVPVAGLVLYLVWKDTKPKTAKAAGIGGIVGVSLIVVFYILIFALGFLGSMFEMTYYSF